MNEKEHFTVLQRWFFLAILADALAIYGVAMLWLKDGDRAMHIASGFVIVSVTLVLLAFVDARLEARSRKRNLRPRREHSDLSPNYWLDDLI